MAFSSIVVGAVRLTMDLFTPMFWSASRAMVSFVVVIVSLARAGSSHQPAPIELERALLGVGACARKRRSRTFIRRRSPGRVESMSVRGILFVDRFLSSSDPLLRTL